MAEDGRWGAVVSKLVSGGAAGQEVIVGGQNCTLHVEAV